MMSVCEFVALLYAPSRCRSKVFFLDCIISFPSSSLLSLYRPDYCLERRRRRRRRYRRFRFPFFFRVAIFMNETSPFRRILKVFKCSISSWELGKGSQT